jgi:hypothetical protein
VTLSKGLKSNAVILYGEDEVISRTQEAHQNAGRGGMFERVGNGLLGDPVEVDGHLGIPHVHIFAALKFARHPARDFVDQLLES